MTQSGRWCHEDTRGMVNSVFGMGMLKKVSTEEVTYREYIYQVDSEDR